MKYLTCLFIAFLCLSCGSSKVSAPEAGNGITLLSYNIRNAWGMDHVTDYSRIAGIIRRVRPDAVALQELDSATIRSYGAVTLNELAKLTGMFFSYSKSISYQGGGYGVGILTREKPLRTLRISLPGKEEKRSLLMVEMKNYILCCTHWSLTETDRLRSVGIINDFVAQLHTSKPIFLAGDLNATPDSPEINLLTRDWNIFNNIHQYTIPSSRPIKCIDYILSHKNNIGVTTLMTNVENEPVASDHLPVWVKIKLPDSF